ncbi:MAG: hypothetical protein BGO03_10350 [Mesorhizobium sp. 61-13]|nr:hypothetical protein [Mesorhizobium sp.]OJU50218.1 MAG: hypothetical protein BGO03_10350 [Mesorhizobium sp. 61-13]
MLQQIFEFLAWVVGAAVVVGVAGAIVGEALRFISRRVTNPKIAWLCGNLSLGEGFGLGLVVASFIVAGAYAAAGGDGVDYGYAWFRYAIGGALAFAAYGIVASRRSA